MKPTSIIFGAGELGRRCHQKICTDYTVLGFVDNNENRFYQTFDGLPIFPPASLFEMAYDKIFIANYSYIHIIHQLNHVNLLNLPHVELFNEHWRLPAERGEEIEAVPCPLCGNLDTELVVRLGSELHPVSVCICPHDGMVLLNPRMSPDRYQYFTTNEYSLYYPTPQDSGLYVRVMAEVVERLQDYQTLDTSTRILEIGAGEGYGYSYLLEHFGISKGYCAIEACRQSLNALKMRGVPNIIESDMEAADFTAYHDFFDIVICRLLLDHCLEPLQMLRTLKACLQKNGLLYLSVPNMATPGGNIKAHWFRVTHTHYFNPTTLGKLLERAGLRTLATGTGSGAEYWVVCALDGGRSKTCDHINYLEQRAIIDGVLCEKSDVEGTLVTKEKTIEFNGLTFTESGATNCISAIKRGQNDFAQEIKAIQLYLQAESPVCIDVGANVGLVSLLMAQLLNAKVYAFEPSPKNFYYLEKNIHDNQLNVEALNVGLSHEPAQMYLGHPSAAQHPRYARDKEHNGLLSIYANIDEEAVRQDADLCSFVTLDAFVYENHIEHIDFIKVDAEGHDLFVLEGGINTLKTLRPIIKVECNRYTYFLAKRKPAELFELLQRLNYNTALYNPAENRFEPVTYEAMQKRFQAVFDVFGFPAECRDQLSN